MKLCAMLVVSAACQSTPQPTATTGSGSNDTHGSMLQPIDASPPAPIVVDAPVAVVAPDAAPVDPEIALRAGKKTGLGSETEIPEVITEDFVRALATGKIKAARAIDPKRMPIDVSSVSVPARDMGNPPYKKNKPGVPYLKAMLDNEALMNKDTNNEFVIKCSNEFVATPNPAFNAPDPTEETPKPKKFKPIPLAYATCSLYGGGEWGESFDVLFVKDAKLGFRMAVQGSHEVGSRYWYQDAVDPSKIK